MVSIDRAETFLQSNGRLLERRLFEHAFRDGRADAVRDAVLAYRNADGGFGNALEPDVRASQSTALHCEIALYALTDAGVKDTELAQAIAGFLADVADADGRVPIIQPDTLEAPHAKHWDFGLFPPPSPNPTASLAGLLAAQGSTHPWVEHASAWLWQRLEQPVDEGHELVSVAAFLAHTPDRERALGAADRVLAAADGALAVLLEPNSGSYGVTPLQIFRAPNALGVGTFPESTYAAFLDELEAGQQDDGGWSIAFEAVNPACESEWRGRWALESLSLLRSWGRI